MKQRELLSRHSTGGDCRPPFFSSVLQRIFSRFQHLYSLRNFCSVSRYSALRLRSVLPLLTLSTANCESEGFATRDGRCAIATAVGKPGEPDQLQYRDTQTYWRNSRNLREAFGIPRWRVSAQRINLRIPLADRKTEREQREGEEEKRCLKILRMKIKCRRKFIACDAIPVLYRVRDISKLDCDKKYS